MVDKSFHFDQRTSTRIEDTANMLQNRPYPELDDQFLSRDTALSENQNQKVDSAIKMLSELDYESLAPGLAWATSPALKSAAKDLASVQEKSNEDVNWDVNIGKALLGLEIWNRALFFLGIALKMNPDLPEKEKIQKLIEICKDKVSIPSFTEPFSERVATAWKQFLEKEAGFLETLKSDDKDKYSKVEDEIEGIFEDALYWPDVRLQIADYTKPTLFFGTQESLMRCFEVTHLINCAPKSVLDNWGFVMGTPYEDLPIDAELLVEQDNSTECFPEYYGDDSFYVYIISLASSPRQGFEALKFLLGDVAAIKYFIRPGFLYDSEEEGMMLSELPDYVDEHGIELGKGDTFLLNRLTSYVPDDKDITGKKELRHDLTYVSSMYGARDPKSFWHDEIEDLEANGATAGYFFFPLSNFKDAAQADEFQQKLKDELKEKVGDTIVKVTGEDKGTDYYYVDFIAWNFGKLNEAAKSFFEASNIKGAGFRIMNDEAKPIVYGPEKSNSTKSAS